MINQADQGSTVDNPDPFAEWLRDRKNRRQLGFRFENCGYVAVTNPAASDGLWVINRKRQVIYAKATLPVRDQLAAAGRIRGVQPDQGRVKL